MKQIYQKSLVFLLSCMAGTNVLAYDCEVDGIYYNLNETEKTVEVTKSNRSNIKYSGEIVIPETIFYSNQTYKVISIGSSAFSNCTNLSSITIPNSVTSIGNSAFSGCKGLTNLTIPNSVISIGNSAFRYCTGLSIITIPKSVTSIGEFVFENCNSIESIIVDSYNSAYDSRDKCNAVIETKSNTLIVGCKNTEVPNSVTSIGNSAFYGCTNLHSITIPNSVTAIGSLAFYGCTGLTSVSIPNSVTLIDDGVFSGCTGLTSVSIPNSVTLIGNSAFLRCTKLNSITLPNSVTSIGQSAFSGCTELNSITIPNSVTSIGQSAFSGCTELNSITIPNSVISIGNRVFSGCTELISVSMSTSITTIGSYAFQYCRKLNSITIPNSVTSIDDGVFSGCTSLKDITIPYKVETIGNYAFYQCTGLTSITIPQNVTSIRESAFTGCNNLRAITVEPGNKVYDSRDNCNAVIETKRNKLIIGCENTEIPNGVTTIGNNAFEACTGLTSITFPDGLSSIGSAAFRGCNNLGTIQIPNSVEYIDGDAFEGTAWYENQPQGLIYAGKIAYKYKRPDEGSIEGEFSLPLDIIIKEGTLGIASGAFGECENLSSIYIPSSLKNIGDNAFGGCSDYRRADFASLEGFLNIKMMGDTPWGYNGNLYINGELLTEVTIPEGRDAIIDNMFRYCRYVKNVTIPNSVVSIGEYAFNECGIKSISIPSSVKSIGNDAFYSCDNLETAYFASLESFLNIKYGNEYSNPLSKAKNIYIEGKVITDVAVPKGISEIPPYMFKNCNSLVSFMIPEGVTSIGDQAFAGCLNLKSVSIPNTVTAIGSGAFSGCSSLENINIPRGVEAICSETFSGCKGLSTITIPNSVTSIDEYAFSGCTSLYKIDIPSSVIYIGLRAFDGTGWYDNQQDGIVYAGKVAYGYKGDMSSNTELTLDEGTLGIASGAFLGYKNLIYITIPSSVICIGSNALHNTGWYANQPDGIVYAGKVAYGYKGNQESNTTFVLDYSTIGIAESAFSRYYHFDKMIVPDNIVYIGNWAMSSGVEIFVKKGSKSLLALWRSGYLKTLYDRETKEKLLPTELSTQSSTQTTATLKVNNIYPEYKTFYNGEPLKTNQVVLRNLKPGISGDAAIEVSYDDVSCKITGNYTTKGMNLSTEMEKSPTAIVVKGKYEEQDAKVIGESFKIGNKQIEGNSALINGLEPSTEYTLTYTTTVRYGEEKDMVTDCSTTIPVATSALELKTLDPKVITQGEVIVAAESNITNDEEKVGFEWRRTDAPDEVKSKSGEAFLYKGKMEGYIHNLTSFNYWRFRPYYESASGNRYYGDWGIVEADDYSYFEPTVHTYDNITIDGNEVEVKGYVTRGTDEVEEQGFAYWEETSASRGDNQLHRAASVPAGAKTVTASGQVMTASISGLAYEHTYNYVAYLKTSKGTYYGEVQSFTTGETPSGIEMASSSDQATVVARYDAQGRRITSPVKGLNFLKMSDGTTRKVFKK